VLIITGDDPLLRSGRVSFAGIVKEVNVAYVPERTSSTSASPSALSMKAKRIASSEIPRHSHAAHLARRVYPSRGWSAPVSPKLRTSRRCASRKRQTSAPLLR
jgi:hypothetical protein